MWIPPPANNAIHIVSLFRKLCVLVLVRKCTLCCILILTEIIFFLLKYFTLTSLFAVSPQISILRGSLNPKIAIFVRFFFFLGLNRVVRKNKRQGTNSAFLLAPCSSRCTIRSETIFGN